jgi:3-(3-hydroxy-phenyl)propionate hydroxylase
MATETAPQAQVHETDVAIIGCGPVGAMLANLLGLQGITTLVLEREATIYNLPRAVHFDDEVICGCSRRPISRRQCNHWFMSRQA